MNCESFCGNIKRQGKKKKKKEGKETNWFPYTCLFKKTEALKGTWSRSRLSDMNMIERMNYYDYYYHANNT